MKKNNVRLLIFLVILLMLQCISLKSKYLKFRFGEAIDVPINAEDLAYAGYDFRLYQKTPVWLLAKACALYDLEQIEILSEKYKKIIDTPDPYLGSSLLGVAIRTQNEEAVRILLAHGANPNFKNPKNKETPTQEIGSTTANIARMVLEHGGDPNYFSEENHSALFNADTLDRFTMIVLAGGNIHLKNHWGGSALLSRKLTFDQLDIVLYALHAGIDYKGQLGESAGDNYGKPKEQRVPLYLVDELRFLTYPLDSDKYTLKMQIVKFLKEKGIDYRMAPIPLASINEIDRIAERESWSERRKKRYLEKY